MVTNYVIKLIIKIQKVVLEASVNKRLSCTIFIGIKPEKLDMCLLNCEKQYENLY